MLPTHLGAIHQSLIQYDELVHLLSDEEIKALVAGQKKHVGVELTKEIVKTKSAARVPKASAEDF